MCRCFCPGAGNSRQQKKRAGREALTRNRGAARKHVCLVLSPTSVHVEDTAADELAGNVQGE